MNAACPYCRAGFEANDVVRTCHDCATPHHQDCFTENGGCSVFGCVNAPGDEPAIKVRMEDLADHVSSVHLRRPGIYAVEPAQLEPGTAKPRFGIVLERAYPDPPNLPWGALLIFSILTGGLFLSIWDLTLARWIREIHPHSRAVYYSGVVTVLLTVALASLIGGQFRESHVLGIDLLGMAVVVLCLMGRFSMRRSLEEYFDQAGSMGLILSDAMTLFFGSVYFQYHLNRVSKQKEHRQQAIA